MICTQPSSETKPPTEAQLDQIAREYHQLPRTVLEQRLGKPFVAPPEAQQRWSVYAPEDLSVFIRYDSRGKPEVVFVSSGSVSETHLGHWPPLKPSRRAQARVALARNGHRRDSRPL